MKAEFKGKIGGVAHRASELRAAALRMTERESKMDAREYVGNYRAALEVAASKGGGTFTVTGLGLGKSANGYYVGGLAPTMKLDFWEGDSAYLSAIAGLIADFVNGNMGVYSSGVFRYLGLWVDNDVLYVDVSEWVRDRDEAIRLGTERGELSIYDNAAEDVLWLNTEGE